MQNSRSLKEAFDLVRGSTILIFVYHQMANIWQIRGAPYGVQWRVPTNFILYVFTLMLVLLSYHRFASRLGSTFEKIAFNLTYVTLRSFRSLVGVILENS